MPPQVQDIAGHVFGRLTAVERIATYKRESVWRCLCECGKVADVKLGNLRNSNTKSCGCLKKRKD